MNSSREAEAIFRMFIQTAGLGLDSVNTLGRIIEGQLNIHKSNPIDKALAHAINQGEGYVFKCDPDQAKTIEKLLKQEGVTARACNFTRTVGQEKQRESYVVVSKADLEKAENIVANYLLSKEKGLTSIENLDVYSKGNTIKLQGLDEVSAALIVSKCEDKGVIVRVTNPTDNKYSIKYAARDEAKMERIVLDTSMEMAGETGKYIRSQIDWSNQNKAEISQKALDFAGELERGKELYIIDGDSKGVIKIDRKNIVINDTVIKNDGTHNKDILDAVATMKNPCITEKEECEKYKAMSEELKHEKVLEIQREDGRPVPDEKQLETMKREREQRELIEKKLREGHSEEVVAESSPYNNLQSIMGLKENEKKNLEYVHDSHEVKQPDAHLMNEAETNYRGIKSADASNERYEQAEEQVWDEERSKDHDRENEPEIEVEKDSRRDEPEEELE